MRKALVVAGVVVAGLSPSFVDWQQADERQRRQIVVWYAVAAGLVAFGLVGTDG